MASKYTSYKILIQELPFQTTGKKLEGINKFFNSFKYRNEITDYWKCLYEFLIDEFGDCDDFAISKYFSLIKLNFDKRKLKLAYAQILIKGKKEGHMVLLYKHSEKLTIILDNYDKKIHRLDNRKNLEIIFTFDDENIYFRESTYPNNLSKWSDLKRRTRETPDKYLIDKNNDVITRSKQNRQDNEYKEDNSPK